MVTGSGRGIGAAIARRLGADGFAVAVWDLDGAAATETAASLTDEGHGVGVDITDRASVAVPWRRPSTRLDRSTPSSTTPAST